MKNRARETNGRAVGVGAMVRGGGGVHRSGAGAAQVVCRRVGLAVSAGDVGAVGDLQSAAFFRERSLVFRHRHPTWKRLVQYHVANAMGFLVWWLGAMALKAMGMNYLLASVFAMFGSVGVSLLT